MKIGRFALLIITICLGAFPHAIGFERLRKQQTNSRAQKATVETTQIAPSTSPVAVGQCQLIIRIKENNYASNYVVADVTIRAQFPVGEGFVYLPIPLAYDANLRYTVEPSSSGNTILFGFLRPEMKYAVCQISLLPTPSSIVISLSNVRFYLIESQQAESKKAVQLLLDKAYDEIARYFKLPSTAYINEVTVSGSNFQGSTPTAKTSDSLEDHVIQLAQDSYMKTSIVILLRGENQQYFLYVVLGFMGILIGFTSGPRFIGSKRRAQIALFVCIIVLVATGILVFGVLSRELLLKDTGVIVTIGTVAGISIGMLIGAVQQLSRP